MDEKTLKTIMICILIGVGIIIALCAIWAIIEELPIRSAEKHEADFKFEYARYKDYLLNESELHLTKPVKLKTQIPSKPFTNNKELRKAFIEVGHSIRILNNREYRQTDPEVDRIIGELKRIAIASGECVFMGDDF